MLAIAGCGNRQESAAPSPMLPTVLVVTVTASPVPNIVELPGRIEPVRTAEVRARVDGIVERMLFEEGRDVEAGAPLFQIDPRDTRALLQQAQAALKRAEAARANAASIVNRFQPLVSRQAVSAQEFDAALATLRQAEANVSDASAEVTRAQLKVDRSTVRAPIAGRVGRALVTEGALVSASAATLMTQINQLSPISATFSQSNTEVLDFEQQIRSGLVKVPDMAHIEVRLILANGQEYGERGFLDFTDLAVDPSTGSQTIRARFPNPKRVLLPGQFVRGRIAAGMTRMGITVPERAIQLDGATASVTVVADDGTVIRRPVVLGPQIEGGWIVRDGLKAGERVVVDGWHKIQPGQRVDAQPAPASEPAPTGATR